MSDELLMLLRAREADLERANETVARLREALGRIASQHLRAEMDPSDAECADWDEGYEAIVSVARAALEADNG